MPTITLSEHQSLAVTRAAAALPVADRDPFLAAVAEALAGHELGDGAVHRAVRTAFAAYWKPPQAPHTPSRWQRDRPHFERASKLPPIAHTRSDAL
jgi:hypothetical protein